MTDERDGDGLDGMAPDDLGVTLDDLITLVHEVRPQGDELGNLRHAVLVSDRLGELGDHLVGHFVDQARHAGASWRAIGASMGVTKQAAQQRFVPDAGDVERPQLFSRFTPRARHAVASARDEAQKSGAGQVGTEHLLLGLLSEPQGLAAQAITALGATSRQVRQGVKRSTGASRSGATAPPAQAHDGRTPFSPQAKQSLKLALREALRRGHNYIGTEHLLLGLLDVEGGTGAAVLTGLGITRQSASTWLTDVLAAEAERRSAAADVAGAPDPDTPPAG